jgi:hypothetical protein
VETPSSTSACMLYESKNVKQALGSLLGRDAKAED